LAFFVDSLQVGGSELNAIRTLEHLDRERFDVTVYHMASDGPLLERYQRLGVPMERVRIRSFRHPSALQAGWRLRRSLRRRRIQILHSHDIYSNIISIPWAHLAGTPVVIASRRWQYAVPSRFHVVANRLVSRWATHVLANSQAVAGTLEREDHVPRSRIEIIPNFVGEDAFREYPAAARRDALAALGIPAGALVVGTVARLSPTKDHATLLRAITPLLGEVPALHVLLIGSGPTREALLAQAAAQGITERVHFAGTLPNIPNPHGLLDLSVLTSTTEGFPNAVVEAMAAARPVVATAVGGTAEAVEPNRTGLLVPPRDPQALTAALRFFLESGERRSTFGTAGQQRARLLFHSDVVLARLSSWYARALANG
jgi:glycosyltransferase involved in cell wall biosynthesis